MGNVLRFCRAGPKRKTFHKCPTGLELLKINDWRDTAEIEATCIQARHQNIERIDGVMKLEQVSKVDVRCPFKLKVVEL